MSISDFRKCVNKTQVDNLLAMLLNKYPNKKEYIDKEYNAAYCRVVLNYQCIPLNFNYEKFKEKIQTS